MADVGSIGTVAEARLRPGQGTAVVRIDELGQFFRYNPDSTATDDGGKTFIKITGQAKGGWENTTKSTKYYDKTGQVTAPIKAFSEIYLPTSNSFVIDFSVVGFAAPPKVIGLEILEPARAKFDYAKANLIELTDKTMKLEFTRPNPSIVGSVLTSVVKATEFTSGNTTIKLMIRLEGI